MPLQILSADLLHIRADALVNPTDPRFSGSGGVDLQIHRAAGEELDAECASLAPLEAGFAAITSGYRLGCRIIHTVGPVWRGGSYGEHAVLNSCYLESLRLAKRNRCRSVAFPLIASGTFGYPKELVLRHAVQSIAGFLRDNEMQVTLCVYDKTACELSKQLSDELQAAIAEEMPEETNTEPDARTHTLEAYLESMGRSFAETLFGLIDARGMTDVECYKKANVDKKTFSKIRCNPDYKPSKQTAVAFAIALRLDLRETQRFLASAGLTLSGSSRFDRIIRYFILNGNYDVFEINEALYQFGQPLLGC